MAQSSQGLQVYRGNCVLVCAIGVIQNSLVLKATVPTLTFI